MRQHGSTSGRCQRGTGRPVVGALEVVDLCQLAPRQVGPVQQGCQEGEELLRGQQQHGHSLVPVAVNGEHVKSKKQDSALSRNVLAAAA